MYVSDKREVLIFFEEHSSPNFLLFSTLQLMLIIPFSRSLKDQIGFEFWNFILSLYCFHLVQLKINSVRILVILIEFYLRYCYEVCDAAVAVVN